MGTHHQNRIGQWVTQMAEALIPWVCLHCRRHPARVVCGDCVASMASIRMQRDEVMTPGGGTSCEWHETHTTLVDTALYGWRYEGVVRSLIRAIKYDGNRSALSWLCQQAGPVLADAMASFRPDLFIPIPGSRDRQLKRGFNIPSVWLATYQGQLAPRASVLVRVSPTVALAGLGVSRREAVIRDQLVMVGEAVRDRRVVLVDDIVTTGSTMQEAARVCRMAGAAWVGVVGMSRTIKKTTGLGDS